MAPPSKAIDGVGFEDKKVLLRVDGALGGKPSSNNGAGVGGGMIGKTKCDGSGMIGKTKFDGGGVQNKSVGDGGSSSKGKTGVPPVDGAERSGPPPPNPAGDQAGKSRRARKRWRRRFSAGHAPTPPPAHPQLPPHDDTADLQEGVTGGGVAADADLSMLTSAGGKKAAGSRGPKARGGRKRRWIKIGDWFASKVTKHSLAGAHCSVSYASHAAGLRNSLIAAGPRKGMPVRHKPLSKMEQPQGTKRPTGATGATVRTLRALPGAKRRFRPGKPGKRAKRPPHCGLAAVANDSWHLVKRRLLVPVSAPPLHLFGRPAQQQWYCYESGVLVPVPLDKRMPPPSAKLLAEQFGRIPPGAEFLVKKRRRGTRNRGGRHGRKAAERAAATAALDAHLARAKRVFLEVPRRLLRGSRFVDLAPEDDDDDMESLVHDGEGEECCKAPWPRS